MRQMQSNSRSWLVTADMGYGHQRAIYPLRQLAEGKIITVGDNENTPPSERKLWKRTLILYEIVSRAKSIPVIGSTIFSLLDSLLHIPSFYPIRNLSKTTLQVNFLESSIKKGLCSGVLEKVKEKHLPIITSFYAPAIAADIKGFDPVYCIICDADLNRVWVAKQPWDSRIIYFAPCGKAVQRLKAYGVSDDKIFLTGFPLAEELLGGKELTLLKSDLAKRLHYLDPHGRFRERHGKSVEHFLGEEYIKFSPERELTITYAVGGAGAQKEIGRNIALGLKEKIKNNELKLNLIAGTKAHIKDYFLKVKDEIGAEEGFLNIIYSEDLFTYFRIFNEVIRKTDILWTKPSELSFYTGLGLPVIMSPSIGSQEKFNNIWLREIRSGIKQLNPEFADQWLFDYLNKGMLAEAAWSGFLKVRKLGLYNILEVLETGKMSREESPIIR
jgi:hypothetical protein